MYGEGGRSEIGGVSVNFQAEPERYIIRYRVIKNKNTLICAMALYIQCDKF